MLRLRFRAQLMPNHARRSPFRLLAPLALLTVAAAIAFVVITSASQSDGSADRTATERRAGRTNTAQDERDAPSAPRPRGKTYTVKTGDTLGLIAERTGVSVERLLELNPDLDPQALVAGQKIALRE
jgi:LysM repeat protein